MCFLCTNSLEKHAFSKRQWQRHNNSNVSLFSRKCLSCIEEFLKKTGSIEHVLVRNHALSNGLVDGKLHLHEGKKIKDRSMQCQLIDREVANAMYCDFITKFKFFIDESKPHSSFDVAFVMQNFYQENTPPD